LLEICALADTLILDEDGVYDPASFNDRLLLGLKGTMSEAELHVIKARLRGGILNKVRRGEYRCVLPTGFVYDETGDVVLDPDAQIRETIAYFFETFSRVGSACQTVKVFRNESLLFPSRLRNSATTVFRPLTASTAIRSLNNPRYAGAYAYGRRHYRRAADGKKILRKRDCTDWLACIPNAHPGYITWEQFQQNLKILETMVEDTNWRVPHHRERGRPCCKGARCADDAADISASDMRRGAENKRHGTSATARTAASANRTASRLPARPSTRRSASWSPRR
jgi:Recombinase